MDLSVFKAVEFREDGHVYGLNGNYLPSVTQIMQPLSDEHYQKIPQRTLDAAAKRGTRVHSAIEVYLNFEEEDIEPEYEPYFKGFLEWHTSLKSVSLIGSEIRLYHKILLYAGTCDFLANVNGKVWLIDFKTTNVVSRPMCAIQLEAYSQALKSHGIQIDEKHIIQLKKDGSYSDIPFPTADAESWRDFDTLFRFYKLKARLKK